jgi:hypothetical protein
MKNTKHIERNRKELYEKIKEYNKNYRDDKMFMVEIEILKLF